MKEILEYLQYLELEELILVKAKIQVLIDSKQKQAELLKRLWITED